MREETAALWKALRSNNPIVIVYYEDAGQREARTAELRSLVPPGSRLCQFSNVEEVFHNLDSILFLVPAQEREAVLTLNGRRECLLSRSAPAVLLLVRGGEGEHALSEAAELASWVQGSDIDPYLLEQVDVPRERESFQRQMGLWPEEWLKQFRSGRIADTLENNLWSIRAGLLEEPA